MSQRSQKRSGTFRKEKYMNLGNLLQKSRASHIAHSGITSGGYHNLSLAHRVSGYVLPHSLCLRTVAHIFEEQDDSTKVIVVQRGTKFDQSLVQ